MDRIDLLGIPVGVLDLDQAVAAVQGLLGVGGYICTPNAEMLEAAQRHPGLRAALRGSAFNVADGFGVVLAARLLGQTLPGRVPGIDLFTAVLARLAQSGQPVYFLGARPGIASRAADRITDEHPGLNIAGHHHGYFPAWAETEVVQAIRHSRPALVAVALGSPKQELFMAKWAVDLSPAVLIGLGGSLDILAGEASRAPPLLGRLGLEWAYRLVRQPTRWRRTLALPAFLGRVIQARWRSRHDPDQ